MKAVALALGLTLVPVLAQATPALAADRIAVVAAENFYGDIARQIGGERVAVVSIMNNPEQDPHLFETTPAVVRQLAGAQIVILNGANYDPWMDKLLAAVPRPDRTVISAAQLTGRKPGDNPHLWYDPVTMPAVATALAEALGQSRQHTRVRLRRAAQVNARDARSHFAACCAIEGEARGGFGNSDRARIRPDDASAWPDDAQRTLPAGHDERHRAERT